MPNNASSHMKIDIDYPMGLAIVREAIWYSPAKMNEEFLSESVKVVVRRRLKEDGKDNSTIVINDITGREIEWEERRNRKPFKKPRGMFIFRITDKSNEQGIGRGDLKEWPAS
jgi:hypothetical protein